MKYLFSRAAALFLVAAVFTLTVRATPGVSASCHILMDGNTGAILSEKNIHRRSLIASTTKIMTAVIVLETMDPDQSMTIPKEAVGIEGSSMYLQEGETLKISDLLYGLMLQSGNDAAVALAIGCSGTVPAFVSKMNEKAQTLSLKNTHFENPNGLDGKEHYSTAYDLGVLTAYALKLPGFRDIVSCKEIRIGNRFLRNHNRLLRMNDDIIGVKTGYTKAAGRILVSAMDYHGRTLIAVTINDGNDWQDHLELYAYGRSCYKQQLLFSKGAYLGEIPLLDGGIGAMYAHEDFSPWIAEGEHPTFKIKYPIIAMGTEGVALVDVYMGDLLIGRMTVDWEVKHYGKITKDHIFPGSLLPPNC